MSAPANRQYGLEWEDGLFGIEPRWAVEPCITAIEESARDRLKVAPEDPCAVAFFKQGGFNKLYKIETSTKPYLMRVALPVDPRRKTLSEIATMEFVRRHTSIPIPTVMAYDCSNDNELRFEWVLMEYVPSPNLKELWRSIPMDRKHEIVRKLAEYQSQLFNHPFEQIGSLFPSSGSPDDKPVISLGETVAMQLDLADEEQSRILGGTNDPDTVEVVDAVRSIIARLRDILPTLFDPSDVLLEEKAVLFHDDLSMSNILLLEESSAPILLDWECVSAVPSWRACQFPALLVGPVRSEMLGAKEAYGTEEIYWQDLLEYERGLLQETFKQEMESINHKWMKAYREGAFKRDFEYAVQHCDNTSAMRRILWWLEAMGQGKALSLWNSMMV